MTNKDYLLGVEYGMQKGKSEERTRILEIIDKMKYWDNPMDIDELINVEELKAKIQSQDKTADTRKGCGNLITPIIRCGFISINGNKLLCEECKAKSQEKLRK